MGPLSLDPEILDQGVGSEAIVGEALMRSPIVPLDPLYGSPDRPFRDSVTLGQRDLARASCGIGSYPMIAAALLKPVHRPVREAVG